MNRLLTITRRAFRIFTTEHMFLKTCDKKAAGAVAEVWVIALVGRTSSLMYANKIATDSFAVFTAVLCGYGELMQEEPRSSIP